MALPSPAAVGCASCASELCVALGDPGVCRSVVMQDLQQLDDCVEFLVIGHKLKEDATISTGPPKLKYESPGKILPEVNMFNDQGGVAPEGLFTKAFNGVCGNCTVTSKHGVSFDWLIALGCLNCGAPVELRRDLVAAAEEAIAADEAEAAESVQGAACVAGDKAILRCRHCGHDIAPLHSSKESDSLVDRMVAAVDDEPSLANAGVYMYGSRKSYNFGSVGKQAWQQRFLGGDFEHQQLQHHLKIMLAGGEGGGKSTCREICERCGHNEAFFSTFQARSADEGMTVMYECTNCHHRKIFNN